MRKIKWGVLGTASIARGCTVPGMKQAKNCELYAVASRDIKKAEAFKEEFGFQKAYGSYDELLSDKEVEAVYIPLPNNLHYEWCVKAMKAGKHVLCEKPMVPTKAQAEELFAIAKECGVFLMEAFAYLHTPYISALREEIRNKTIGDIRYIESAFMVQSCPMTDFRMHKENYGGAFYDLGCYSISQMVWLLDSIPNHAEAITEYTDENIDIFTTAYLKFPGDIRASLSCGMFFGLNTNSRMDRLFIRGTNGAIKSDTEFNQSGKISYTIYKDGKRAKKTFKVRQNYALEIEDLGNAILSDVPPVISPEFSIKNATAMDLVLSAMKY